MRHGISVVVLALLASACVSDPPNPGHIEGPTRARAAVEAQDAARRRAGTQLPPSTEGETPADEKQILFGDLHVHSTYSVDAFIYSLPIFNGEGAHPPADACDFARYCSGLDFFSINDHAEGLTTQLWKETKKSIRQCNALSGDPAHPDLVAFTGWEWTQTGRTPETHYGHKNVLFRDVEENELPARPISSIDIATYEEERPPPAFVMYGLAAAARLLGYDPYADLITFMGRLAAAPACPAGVDTRDLPPECKEAAATPEILFRKLDEWGFPSLVIPHGLAWGIHAPPGATLKVQLSRAQHDPDRQRLIEVSSGHGNSEEFRNIPQFLAKAGGERICPEPTKDFLPCCWRAGELMRQRCGDLPDEECEHRVEQAKQYALDGGVSPDLVFPDTRGEDWLDCDQCRDCFKPAMTLRPGMSAQYATAITNLSETDDEGRPLRFRWGFISSTDNHASRPGTGYKQYDRPIMTDSRGLTDAETRSRVRALFGPDAENPDRPKPVRPSRLFELFDTERKASFMYPGGIVAVHSSGRDRGSIWDALVRREVYGTSGPRILLWFDLLNGPKHRASMGSDVSLAETPRFEVRAVGSFKQKPGCPQETLANLSTERIHDLCRNECYNPSDERHAITAIEVVRIRPQEHAGESIAARIEDPWLRVPCGPDPAGCRVTFEDPEFASAGRDTAYYVRALQEPTPAINAGGLRPLFDPDGRVVQTTPCHGGFGTDTEDDCLQPAAERAWSSPIYVDYAEG